MLHNNKPYKDIEMVERSELYSRSIQSSRDVGSDKLNMKVRFVVLLVIFIDKCRPKVLNLERSDNVLELIQNAGFKGEAHEAETQDGYLLRLHRILPKFNSQAQGKKPVFLMHGILATAADFLVTGPDIALGFLFAESGYDVWLGNARGSQHSMRHRSFSNNSRDFWNFSWHEIGYFDLAAMIDHVLNETKNTTLFYAAHSQGTTSFLVLLSTRPEYNEKIQQAYLMAPSAFRKKLPRLRTILIGLRFLVSSRKFLIKVEK